MSHDFKISLNFEGLVLGCIDADWRDKMYTLVRLHRSDFEISAKNRPNFCRNGRMKMKFLIFSRFSMKFAIFLRNFDEILPEFHRNVQEMTKNVDTP